MARQGRAGSGAARRGLARQGWAGLGRVGHGAVRLGEVGHGAVRLGEVGHGQEGEDRAMKDRVLRIAMMMREERGQVAGFAIALVAVLVIVGAFAVCGNGR